MLGRVISFKAIDVLDSWLGSMASNRTRTVRDYNDNPVARADAKYRAGQGFVAVGVKI